MLGCARVCWGHFVRLGWSPLEKKVWCLPSPMSGFGNSGFCWAGLWKAAVLGQCLRDWTWAGGEDTPVLMQGEQL